jgi:hypothetical protein
VKYFLLMVYLLFGCAALAQDTETPDASSAIAFAKRLPCPIYILLLNNVLADNGTDAFAHRFISLETDVYVDLIGQEPSSKELGNFTILTYKMCHQSSDLMFYDAAAKALNKGN